MKQSRRTLLALAFCAGTIGVAAAELTMTKELAIRVLRATDFAEVNRAILRRECGTKPEMANSPVCQNIALVSDQVIEEAALPYLTKYMTSVQASDALAFWLSPTGQDLSKAMLKVTEYNDPALLTQKQTAALDRFNKSAAGLAMSRFASDRSQGVAVLNAIARSRGN